MINPMNSAERTKLIASVFLKSSKIYFRTRRNSRDEEVIADLQSLLDRNLIDHTDMYNFLNENAFRFPDHFYEEVLWWMILQVKDMIMQDDFMCIFCSQLMFCHESDIYQMFGHMIEKIPIDNLELSNIVDMYGEDRATECMNKRSINDIGIELINTDDYKILKSFDFFKDYVLSRIDELNGTHDMDAIYNVLRFVGPNDQIREYIEAEICFNKYIVLPKVLQCMEGVPNEENKYIIDIYEQYTQESVSIDDKYVAYIAYLNGIRINFKNSNVIFSFEKFAKFHSSNTTPDVYYSFLKNKKSFQKKYKKLKDNNFSDIALFEEQVDKFDQFVTSIPEMLSKMIAIQEHN